MSTASRYDLLVVGGGINGAGIARDAAGRGLSVLLCEQHDLASHTSSASTKLIHGGLRYLEHYEFGLVRKALRERETLLDSAPHIMRPLEFVLPHDAHLRPAWLIRLGLLLYDNLAPRKRLPAARPIRFDSHPSGAALQQRFSRGFVYPDGWVDDARLVVLNAIGARERGARVLTRTRCDALAPAVGGWSARLASADGSVEQVQARTVVNATGPWAGSFLADTTGTGGRAQLRLVKGSHIVVPALFDHEYAYLFQTPDRRVVFAIPYEGRYTLIGTTDIEYTGDPAAAKCEPAEISYLCDSASRYFRQPISPAQVVWSFAGVRPLQRDESSDPAGISRDYEIVRGVSEPPLLSVVGGKITTYRLLAEEVVDQICTLLGHKAARWTADALLPGGDLPGGNLSRYQQELQGRHPWADVAWLARLTRAYGSRCERIIAAAASLEDLGEEVLPGLYAAELRYLCDKEWAKSGVDILWRRSKLGLALPAGSEARLDAWIGERRQ